ncbi:MAG TPA: 5-formyltetrahydrofolate cyclo-ligase [Actinomycetota bacterium]|jgi:5-formyltetrahydrofolate cyclo-ligase
MTAPAIAGDVAAEKERLRTKMRAVRDAIPLGERTRMARRIEENLFSLPEVEAARTVLLFSSFGSEVPTDDMIERLLREGRSVVLPYLVERRMEAAGITASDPLVATSYGPKEPPHRVSVDPIGIDVAIAPGLAFDRQGYRLGYGGGHFDRYLGRLRSDASRVGIAFAVQLIPNVPRGPGDTSMHIVVTEQEVIRP